MAPIFEGLLKKMCFDGLYFQHFLNHSNVYDLQTDRFMPHELRFLTQQGLKGFTTAFSKSF